MKIADIGFRVLVLLVIFIFVVASDTALPHIAAVDMIRIKYEHMYSHPNEMIMGISA
jgi:hypothetical protein